LINCVWRKENCCCAAPQWCPREKNNFIKEKRKKTAVKLRDLFGGGKTHYGVTACVVVFLSPGFQKRWLAHTQRRNYLPSWGEPQTLAQTIICGGSFSDDNRANISHILTPKRIVHKTPAAVCTKKG